MSMSLGLGLGLTHRRGVSLAALIRALFRNGEAGAFLDPSDSTTLFQDAAGTTPAGIGDPVRLALDKSQGLVLGAELVANGGGPFTETTGYSAALAGGDGTFAVVDGELRLTTNDTTESKRIEYDFTAEVGKRYEIRFSARGVAPSSRASAWVNVTTVSIDFSESSQEYVARVLATGTAAKLRFYVATSSGGLEAGDFVSLGSLSIREISGNHALAPSDAARPLLQENAQGRRYLSFNGVDNILETPLIGLGAAGASGFVAVGYDIIGSSVGYAWSASGTRANTGLIVNDGEVNAISVRIQRDTSIGILNFSPETSLQVVSANFPNDGSDLKGLLNKDEISLFRGSSDNINFLRIGARLEGAFSEINFYGLVARLPAVSPQQMQDVHKFLAQKTGVDLS